MTLPSGARLGSYATLYPIGAGGMGDPPSLLRGCGAITRTGVVAEVLPPGSVPAGVWQKFALSRDGRRLAWIEPYEEGDLWMMTAGR